MRSGISLATAMMLPAFLFSAPASAHGKPNHHSVTSQSKPTGKKAQRFGAMMFHRDLPDNAVTPNRAEIVWSRAQVDQATHAGEKAR